MLLPDTWDHLEGLAAFSELSRAELLSLCHPTPDNLSLSPGYCFLAGLPKCVNISALLSHRSSFKTCKIWACHTPAWNSSITCHYTQSTPEIFCLIHSNPPFQPHPTMWPLFTATPHLMPVCPVHSAPSSLVSSPWLEEGRRPEQGDLFLSQHALQVKQWWLGAIVSVWFIGIFSLQSGTLHFVPFQLLRLSLGINAHLNLDSEWGNKLRSNCEMDIWDLADIAC